MLPPKTVKEAVLNLFFVFANRKILQSVSRKNKKTILAWSVGSLARREREEEQGK
jgi:hypothetical protein